MLESVGPEILNLKENGKPQKLTILRTCWQKIDNCVDSQKNATDSRNSFLRFRAGLKVNLRQYIKSDFDLF